MVSSTKTKDKKSCEDYSLLKKFPQELWNIVYSFLGINSLLSLSKTCRLHYSYIVNQSIWKNVAGKACIGEPKRKYKTYYELVSSKSDRICECCHTLGKPTGHQAVLPVRIKCLDNTSYIARLCLRCRKVAYANHEIIENPSNTGILFESFWNYSQTQELIGYQKVKLYFSLEWHQLTGISCEGGYFRIDDVFDRARRVYGGNIGIEARQKAKQKRIKAHTKCEDSKKKRGSNLFYILDITSIQDTPKSESSC